MSRIVPVTALHCYYRSLEGKSTEAQTRECDAFLRNPERLLTVFLDSLAEFEVYCNLDEGFGLSGRKPLDSRDPRHRVVGRLAGSETIRVPEVAGDYVFRYVGREINPWRTTKSTFSDGRLARSSGSGGVDYLGRTLSGRERPILGEAKEDSDKTAFYAFIQLLNYLSKFATQNQVDRCNRFQLFGGRIDYPPSFDLHILLADFNDRGTKQETIGMTRDLADAFRHGLGEVGRGDLVGRILCLRMDVENYSGTLRCEWDIPE